MSIPREMDRSVPSSEYLNDRTSLLPLSIAGRRSIRSFDIETFLMPRRVSRANGRADRIDRDRDRSPRGSQRRSTESGVRAI